MEKLVMQINDYNSIDKAKIEINRINVVGGVNGSGKSTASKILYSFLKGNSIKRREYALQLIAEHINSIIDNLDYEGNEYDLPDHLNVDDEDSVFCEKYDAMLDISKKHDELAKRKTEELSKKLSQMLDDITETLKEKGFNLDDLELGDDISMNATEVEYFLHKTDSMDFTDEEWEIGHSNDEYMYFYNFSDIHALCSLYNDLMNSLFVEDDSKLSVWSKIFIEEKEFLKDIESCDVEFYIESDDSKYDPYSYFFNTNFINSAYYVDNVSILDLLISDNLKFRQLFHMTEIIEDLFESNSEKVSDEKVKIILDKIEEIIKGKYRKTMPVFETNITDKNNFFRKNYTFDDVKDNPFLRKLYESESKVNTYNFNTPSGTKQIGVIQLLLQNNKLKQGGYLIIDEPEVNLHPEWQIKFAEILVLLAKELDITLYLNSHSPMFIEAVSLYSQFYDLMDETNFYLTQETGEDKYAFKKINPMDMGAVYENLTKPYDELDKLKAKILFKE